MGVVTHTWRQCLTGCLSAANGGVVQGFPPPPTTTAAAAFHELCGALPGYADVPSARAPFKQGRVSLPPLGMSFANARGFLDGAALEAWSNWRKLMLRSPAELQEELAKGEPKPFSDSTLVGRPRVYARFEDWWRYDH